MYLRKSKTMEWFLAVVWGIPVKLENDINSSLWLWSLVFITYFHSTPALIPKMKPWLCRNSQKCSSTRILFPSFEGLQSQLEAVGAVGG